MTRPRLLAASALTLTCLAAMPVGCAGHAASGAASGTTSAAIALTSVPAVASTASVALPAGATRFAIPIPKFDAKIAVPTTDATSLSYASNDPFASPSPIFVGLIRDEATLRRFVPAKHQAEIPAIDWSRFQLAYVYATRTNGAVAAEPTLSADGSEATITFDFSSHEIAAADVMTPFLVLPSSARTVRFEAKASGRPDQLVPRSLAGAAGVAVVALGAATEEGARDTAARTACDDRPRSYTGSTYEMHEAAQEDIAACRAALASALATSPYAMLAARLDEVRKLRCEVEEELYWTDVDPLVRGDGTLRFFTYESCESALLRTQLHLVKADAAQDLGPRAARSIFHPDLAVPPRSAATLALTFKAAAVRAATATTRDEPLTAAQATKDAADLEKLDGLASALSRDIAAASRNKDKAPLEQKLRTYFTSF